MGRSSIWSAVLVAAALATPAGAGMPVAVELVLAVDISSSVDDREYALQMNGIAAAFRAPDVVRTISEAGGVAVALMQWSDRAAPVRWRLLDGPDAILAFAAEVEATPRAGTGSTTGIGNAIVAGLAALEANGFAGARPKIDISGDGHNNTGLPLQVAQRRAQAGAVTVNALAILTDVANLADYFAARIITGPDAFVVEAADYGDIARAMRIKLLRELTAPVSRAPDAQISPS